MRTWQLRQIRIVLKILKWYLAVLAAASLRASGQSWSQRALLALGYAMALLADWCPRLLTNRSMDMWYSCAMTIPILYIIPPFCSFPLFVQTLIPVKVIIVFFTYARMHLPFVVLFNGVRMLVVLWAIATNEPAPVVGQGWMWLRGELIFSLGTSCMVGMLSSQMKMALRQDIEARRLEDRHAGISALMDMACDAVVGLDRDLGITGPTSRLAAFLIHSTPALLEHRPFEDLLFDDNDREVFRTRLCPTGSGQAPTGEIAHLRMRASNNVAISVVVYSFYFHGYCGQPHWVLGLREHGECMRHHAQAAQDGQLVTAADQVSELQEVVAMVDPTSPQLPIVDHSPGFSTSIMRVSEGSCLVSALAKPDRFVDWLQARANMQYNFDEDDDGGEDGERSPEFFFVKFQPR